ncbi:MAG: hypothetical protein FJ144_01065 [Deltaproteobacteria bacterium]|nr:hypothetical protein [Deltaproteobacteria bacterium]
MKDFVGPGALVELVLGGLLLRPMQYREVVREPASMRLCFAVAVLAGAATGIGRSEQIGLAPVIAVLLHVIVTLLTVAIESGVVWLVAGAGLRRGIGYGAVVRPMALATAPRLVYALLGLGTGIPALEILGTVWLLAAFVLAVDAAIERGWAAAVAVALAVGVLRWGTSLSIQMM